MLSQKYLEIKKRKVKCHRYFYPKLNIFAGMTRYT